MQRNCFTGLKIIIYVKIDRELVYAAHDLKTEIKKFSPRHQAELVNFVLIQDHKGAVSSKANGSSVGLSFRKVLETGSQGNNLISGYIVLAPFVIDGKISDHEIRRYDLECFKRYWLRVQVTVCKFIYTDTKIAGT